MERPDIQERTVYMKGLPVEASLDQLEVFFNKLAPVEIIRMRNYGTSGDKTGDKTGFKGSVLVQFAAAEKAEEVSKMTELKYGEFELKEICMVKKWREFKESTSTKSSSRGGDDKDVSTTNTRTLYLHSTWPLVALLDWCRYNVRCREIRLFERITLMNHADFPLIGNYMATPVLSTNKF